MSKIEHSIEDPSQWIVTEFLSGSTASLLEHDESFVYRLFLKLKLVSEKLNTLWDRDSYTIHFRLWGSCYMLDVHLLPSHCTSTSIKSSVVTGSVNTHDHYIMAIGNERWWLVSVTHVADALKGRSRVRAQSILLSLSYFLSKLW